MVLDEFHQLARGTAEPCRGGLVVEVGRPEHIEGLGQHGWVVVVRGANGETADLGGLGDAPRLPKGRAAIAEWNRSPDLRCEQEPKPPERFAVVLCRGASFARLPDEAGRRVSDGDVGLDFVAVLSAGAAGALLGSIALGQECLGRERCGVGRGEKDRLYAFPLRGGLSQAELGIKFREIVKVVFRGARQ